MALEKEKKNIEFKYRDGKAISLGVPEDIIADEGNQRDGGCNLKFSTSELSIGIKERFALYLFAEDINEITFKIWKPYLKAEPARAKKDLNRTFESLNK